MRKNPIIDADSYKATHYLFYEPSVTNVYSYAESRGGRYPGTLFFGLQPFINDLAENRITRGDVDEAEDFCQAHGVPFNREGWDRIVSRHNGYLPLHIKAVPEGTFVPTRNVLCTVENTDPELPWLTSYVETALLRQLWYATTVATRIFNMKKRIKAHFEATSDSLDALPFALLDFSSRGCSSYGANEIGGAAYLAHFLGSDSMPAVRYANEHYDCAMSGFSVPATEHSVMCSWGADREEESFRHFIEQAGGPGKIVSVVADTWNVFEAADKFARMAATIQKSGTTLVFRPDSGEAEVVIPEVLRRLASGFGTTVNSKGLHVLNGAKVLWGDGINEESHMRPFHVAWDQGFAADSIMTGSGGGLMQADIDRDTCKFAFKASAISKDGGDTWTGIAKDPITDPGKRSKMGRLSLHQSVVSDGSQPLFTTQREGSWADTPDLLRTVYVDGDVTRTQSLDEIRQRIDAQL